MFKRVVITSVSIYTAGRENCVRAYIKCQTVGENSSDAEKFTIVGFFTQNDQKWEKENNENCTLDVLLDAINEKTELMAEITETKKPCLSEGSFVFGK